MRSRVLDRLAQIRFDLDDFGCRDQENLAFVPEQLGIPIVVTRALSQLEALVDGRERLLETPAFEQNFPEHSKHLRASNQGPRGTLRSQTSAHLFDSLIDPIELCKRPTM